MHFNRKWIALIGSVLVMAAVHAAGEAELLGQWKGNWEGGGDGGRFEITLEKAGDALGGKVDVGQASGDYSSPFSKVTLEGGKLKARYDYPPEPQAEIVLDGAFDGAKGTGTWNMVQKGGDEAFFSGTWTVEKK